MRRVCKKCGEEKYPEEMHKDKLCKLGYRSICNECYRKYRRQYSKKYKSDMKKKHRCIKSKKCYLHGYATDPENEVCNMKPCIYCRYYK